MFSSREPVDQPLPRDVARESVERRCRRGLTVLAVASAAPQRPREFRAPLKVTLDRSLPGVKQRVRRDRLYPEVRARPTDGQPRTWSASAKCQFEWEQLRR